MNTYTIEPEQDADVTNVQLLREIKSMGYNGGKSILNNYLKKYGKERKRNTLMKIACCTLDDCKSESAVVQKG